jgi:hypothetical protein
MLSTLEIERRRNFARKLAQRDAATRETTNQRRS